MLSPDILQMSADLHTRLPNSKSLANEVLIPIKNLTAAIRQLCVWLFAYDNRSHNGKY